MYACIGYVFDDIDVTLLYWRGNYTYFVY